MGMFEKKKEESPIIDLPPPPPSPNDIQEQDTKPLSAELHSYENIQDSSTPLIETIPQEKEHIEFEEWKAPQELETVETVAQDVPQELPSMPQPLYKNTPEVLPDLPQYEFIEDTSLPDIPAFDVPKQKTLPQLPVIATLPGLKEAHNVMTNKPIYVRTDQYSTMMSHLDALREYMQESHEVIASLTHLKKNADIEHEQYMGLLEDIQRKLIYVDNVLFHR